MNPRYVIPAIAAGIAIVAIIVMMNAESQFSENQVVTQSPDENQITIPTPQPVQENEIEPIPQSIPIEENESAPEVEQTVQSIEYEIFVTNGEKHIVPLGACENGKVLFRAIKTNLPFFSSVIPLNQGTNSPPGALRTSLYGRNCPEEQRNLGNSKYS